MELHQVYASQDHNVENKILVIGVLYEIGPPDEFLSKVIICKVIIITIIVNSN